MPDRTCLDCGAVLRAHGPSLRCRSCNAKNKWTNGTLRSTPQQRVTVACLACGVTFGVIPSRVTKASACSRACASELKRRVRGVEHPLYRPPVTLVCEGCSETFEAKPCFADRQKGKRFCSRECVGAWVTGHQPRSSSIEEIVATYLDAAEVAYTRQVRIGRFVADFVVGDTIIEVDGSYWHSLPKVIARDARKNATYASLGYRLIRIGEPDVRAANFEALTPLLQETAA